MVVILDNIRSLHNVGSIFRTADAVGVEKLYLCGITPAPRDRFGEVPLPLAKVALGAEKTVAWEKAASTSRLITKLKKEGFKILALELDAAAVPYYALSTTDHSLKKIALVLGAEVEGVSPAILKKCDTIIEIPMQGIKESLNVGVAFGIAAYHLSRSRFK
jgi:tRNA G18 (ribose-2'-O)-methylase SpoU